MQYEVPAYGISDMSAKTVLAENIQKLMDANPGLSSLVKVATEAKRRGHAVSKNAVDTARKGTNAATIDSVDAIARAFEMEAWQLLVPGMNPKNPPVLNSVGETEDALYRKLGAVAKEIVELGVTAGGGGDS